MTGSADGTGGAPLLRVRDLTVEFRTPSGWAAAVRDVGFDLAADEVFGLVGESGSGKSVTAMAVLGLLPATGARVRAGSVEFAGTELVGRSGRELDRVRGSRIGTVFQEPMTSLNPAFTVGEQIAEVVRRHRGASRTEATARAVEMLDRVGIPNPARAARQYPHHFSGGMRQRAMIAIALACSPALLIADEPTTALDVTVQAMILELIEQLRAETGMAVLLITHDLGVVAETAHRIGVMYAGQLVEVGSARSVLDRPRHPYSSALLQSVLRLDDTPGAGEIAALDGQVPAITTRIEGCRFAPRCAHAVPGPCTSSDVPPHDERDGVVRCVRSGELDLEGVR